MEQHFSFTVSTILKKVVDMLMAFYEKDLHTIRQITEDDFRGSAHCAAGMFIHNSWHLWWYTDHRYEYWLKEKPALVQWFLG